MTKKNRDRRKRKRACDAHVKETLKWIVINYDNMMLKLDASGGKTAKLSTLTEKTLSK